MKIPTLIDNVDGNTLLKALESLLIESVSLDIATGTFEIGAFLSLGEKWRHLDGIRLLMGDEPTKRTKAHLISALQDVTNDNIESVKERDDALHGLAAVQDAIRKGQIAVRVYDKAKFHAKLNLMHAQNSSLVDFATVGSSNFTTPGLTQNVELNSFITDPTHIEKLNDWYNARWEEASEVKAELLRTIERHLREYPPFTVYAKALHTYFRGREKPADEWEENDSVVPQPTINVSPLRISPLRQITGGALCSLSSRGNKAIPISGRSANTTSPHSIFQAAAFHRIKSG